MKWKAAHAHIGADFHFQCLHQGHGIRVHFLMLQDTQGAETENGFTTQPDILLNGTIRHIGEFLMDHRDTGIKRGFRALKTGGFALKGDFAFIRVIHPEQAFHQRRFPRAVFTHQGMDCTWSYLQADMIQSNDSREALADIFHFQDKF